MSFQTRKKNSSRYVQNSRSQLPYIGVALGVVVAVAFGGSSRGSPRDGCELSGDAE
jgi:hypothetical protein